ncbi:MAG TPA: PP2C family protein-serine/threonine phosphatase [Candidatus Nanopelagicales bacterium]|nr:PP2C family protein-serine/threonine phosphatase [Candidatus Nanopelagicales bacterium]
MPRWRSDLARDLRPLLAGLAGVVVVSVVVLTYAHDVDALPVAALLIPVMAVALVAGAWATGAVALAAVLAGGAMYAAGDYAGRDMQLRYGALVVGSVLSVALSDVRRRREERTVAEEAALSTSREQERAEALLVQMLERLPELSGARDIPDVALRACRIARDVFGAETASYWQVDGDRAILLAREPHDGDPHPLTVIPLAQMVGGSQWSGRSRTTWVRAGGLAADDPRRRTMEQVGALAGTSTPIRVDFVAVGFLAMSWSQDRPDPDRSWMETLDRLGDQIALAKTVVRRRLAQDENRELTDRLQASFLPARVDDVPNTVVRLLYRPGLRQLLLGGDFLDVVAEEDGSTAFLIGDVSGHGPEQAALAATLRAAWRGATSVPGSTIKDRARALDSVVNERRPSSGLFVTMITGQIDPAMSSISYVSAGHPPPILLHPPRPAPLGGPPLGVLPPGASLDLHVVRLEPDESVLLVTDGLFEGHDAPGSTTRLGFDGFLDLLAAHLDVQDEHILDRLADEVEELHGAPLPDDAAALLLTRRRG